MDPVSTAIATAGTLATVYKDLIEKIFGPAAEEFGQMLREKAVEFRIKNLLAVMAKTDELLRKAGVHPRPVPLRTLLPIVEGASLEDDETLSQKWAGLLASAAASLDDARTHPGFPRILSEITPREAVMLDRLTAKPGGPIAWDAFRKRLAAEFHCPEESLSISYWNLFRLGLWYNAGVLETTGPCITISAFGKSFLAATHGPAPGKTT